MCSCQGNQEQIVIDASAMVAPEYSVVRQVVGDCPYTIEQINSWLQIVYCIKDNGYYVDMNITKQTMNVYIGVLLSSQNYSNNICYFQRELEEIESFITVVTIRGLCQS